jgi:hypothetical protein
MILSAWLMGELGQFWSYPGDAGENRNDPLSQTSASCPPRLEQQAGSRRERQEATAPAGSKNHADTT